MTASTWHRRGGHLAVTTAVVGTILIAFGAFWLSFTALADLATRSGISADQAWAWPLIVDGIIVVATVSVVALAGHRSAWYPWMLLAAGALVSVTANAIHAVIAADADVPPVLAASVAAVPPLVLLAITHLTVILTRPTQQPQRQRQATVLADQDRDQDTSEVIALLPESEAPDTPEIEPADGGADRRLFAAGLRDDGWSNKRIARHFGVHPSTVGRWLPQMPPETSE